MKTISKPMLVYRPEELAQLLGVGRNSIYRLLRSGKIRSIKIGTHYLVTKDAVDAFLGVAKNDA